MPPAPDAPDGEGGGAAGDAEADPARVGRDAAGCPLARFRQHEAVRPDRLGLALGAQFAARVLEAADRLLLGIDREGGLARGLERLRLGAAGEPVLAAAQLRKPTPNRAAGDARHRRHCQNTAATGGIGLTGSPQAPVALPKKRRKCFKTSLDGNGVNHPTRIVRPENRAYPQSRLGCFGSDP